MVGMRNWLLAAAVVLVGLGLGATTAHAAQFGIYVGGPVAYASQSPGPGYIWVNGYMNDGYWVAGRWAFAGYRNGDNGWNRDRDDWNRDRGWNRDRYRDNGWRRDRGDDGDRRDSRDRGSRWNGDRGRERR